ncbi:hypothetical protein V5O48_008551 [Marasmius crinis-equi]|uniref:YDG domain-containing protein n=1 Tax=Marasmius crinis-equi TaxID=585013 RepID=A0ABR3FE22_9AGAR
MGSRSPTFKYQTPASMQTKPQARDYAYGHPKKYPIGTVFPDRKTLSDSMVHGPTQAGIHANTTHGAYSIVISGGYEDDEDHGSWFWYTGEGGRRNDGAGPQVKDQEWGDKGNRALNMSFHQRKPVRVIRGHVRDSPYGPPEGLRYDGLYLVREVKTMKGKSGFKVCKARFVRQPNQDPLPPPRWTVDQPVNENIDISEEDPAEADSGSESSESGSDSDIEVVSVSVQRPAPLVACTSSANNVRKRTRDELDDDDDVVRKPPKAPIVDTTCTLPKKSSLTGKKKLVMLPKITKNKSVN